MNQAKARTKDEEDKLRWNSSIQFNLSDICLQFGTRRLSCPTDLFNIFELLDLDLWTVTVFVGYQPGTTLPARVEVRKMRKRHRCSWVALSSSVDFYRHGLSKVLQTSCEDLWSIIATGSAAIFSCEDHSITGKFDPSALERGAKAGTCKECTKETKYILFELTINN